MWYSFYDGSVFVCCYVTFRGHHSTFISGRNQSDVNNKNNDVYGGHSRHLYDNIRKIINGRKDAQSTIRNMQRTVIKSEVNLVRIFKLKTCVSPELKESRTAVKTFS